MLQFILALILIGILYNTIGLYAPDFYRDYPVLSDVLTYAVVLVPVYLYPMRKHLSKWISRRAENDGQHP